jgi:hypothetical protein
MLDVRRDCGVRKVLDEAAFPVGTQALGIEGIESSVQGRVLQQ